jgi:hypothetical protein
MYERDTACKRSFVQIGLGVQKLIGGTHRQRGDLISLLLFFANKILSYYVVFALYELNERILGRLCTQFVVHMIVIEKILMDSDSVWYEHYAITGD